MRSIHWQNMQLYVFGVLFGVVTLRMDANWASVPGQNPFHGFNAYAYATVATLAICGLLVSFILKYLDNVAKCFCAALSMLCVSLLDSTMKHEAHNHIRYSSQKFRYYSLSPPQPNIYLYHTVKDLKTFLQSGFGERFIHVLDS